MAASLAACAHNFDGVAKLNDLPFGGTNEANLAAMVANPADLIHGHGQDCRSMASPRLRPSSGCRRISRKPC